VRRPIPAAVAISSIVVLSNPWRENSSSATPAICSRVVLGGRPPWILALGAAMPRF